MTDRNNSEVLRRWRLILGRYAEAPLPRQQGDSGLDQALDYLYGREYQRRGLRTGAGTLDPSQVKAIDWLQQVRKLFPHEVFERMQVEAVEKYHLTELLEDPKLIEALEPNQALARTLLGLRGRLRADVLDAVRSVIRHTVDEIVQRLRPAIVNAVVGQRNRFRQSHLRSAQNFDWRATIAANLKHFDPASGKLVIERPRFNARVKRHLPWDVILCVDQSGSMIDSVMYSAVVAGILSSLPSVNVRLVVFDTSVVDLSHLAHDAVEVLMTVQLGGGTNIGQAMQYCEKLVATPHRTVLALVSDFEEGTVAGPLLASVRRLAEARVKLIGLAALDEQTKPVYDRTMAQRLANHGMHVAALTPVHFAEWLAEVMG